MCYLFLSSCISLSFELHTSFFRVAYLFLPSCIPLSSELHTSFFRVAYLFLSSCDCKDTTFILDRIKSLHKFSKKWAQIPNCKYLLSIFSSDSIFHRILLFSSDSIFHRILLFSSDSIIFIGLDGVIGLIRAVRLNCPIRPERAEAPSPGQRPG